jgi:predicted rRNA methylase YqxC with S4 and FtsJ domains
MQSVNLTDDQLWRAIAQNTNAMTALIHQQLELGPAFNTPYGIIRQAKLRESNAERIDKLARDYQEYTAELRRRYSLDSQESADLTIRGSDAATVTAA